ncbi:DNA circularization N-terminal domain-containing protein [Edwardsiella hoshinae]|uniref:DNA circularization N-terminal domain-containing protein n=1 Tax=Edwardsiella hoshinae TaxID=93378 RepID=UPI002113F724|nr:DNA circularization N-terminal domain-containing protein [Edwardsiella hoshinae]
MLRESTSHGRDHADHEYPFIDGADVHDLGRKARNIRLTAVFWGEDYDTRLQNFLAVLDKAGAGELIHPVYGSIPKAQLIECQVSHDAEQPDYCTVELVFLESSTGTATQAVVKPAQWGMRFSIRWMSCKAKRQHCMMRLCRRCRKPGDC